jgi:uncharacterized membrane protein
MDKQAFLVKLEKELKKRKVQDIKEIIDEYEDYINHQLEAGKKEKNIIAFIGEIDSIVEAYDQGDEDRRNRWFDIAATSLFAIPILIMMYGLLIGFIGLVIASWAVAIYYLFSLSSLSFMPYIPLIPKFGFILTFLSFSLFMALFSYRYFLLMKSMTNQYVVKQKIVVGKYELKVKYMNLMKKTSIAFLIILVLTTIIAMISAKSFEYWHVWEWFS